MSVVYLKCRHLRNPSHDFHLIEVGNPSAVLRVTVTCIRREICGDKPIYEEFPIPSATTRLLIVRL